MLDGEPKKANDLELLARLRGLAWLSVTQQKRLAATITSYDVARDELIFSDNGGQGSDLFVLLSGAARFSCLGVKRGNRNRDFSARSDSAGTTTGPFSLSVSLRSAASQPGRQNFPRQLH